jgi:serine protease Do
MPAPRRRVLVATLFALVMPILDGHVLMADPPQDDSGPRALSKAFREASRRATPSVVTIMVYGQTPAIEPEPVVDENGQPIVVPEPTDQQLTGIGSGVIVGSDGQIITNNHVISRAKRVSVQLADDTRYEASNILGDGESDIAVLSIKLETPGPAAEIGDSDSMEIGDWVLAIGSPFRLEATVSAGIISAKNRRLGRIPRSRLFQTDAAINPGNSGGPLIDLDGKVIGINTAIATKTTGYQGVGFAVPINQAKWIADELANHGTVRRAAIGITMAELNQRIAKLFKLEPYLGVLAYEIIDGSAAQKAGIQKLDVITSFAGVPVRLPATLRELVEQSPIGSTQTLTIIREGKEQKLEIVLAKVEDPRLPGEASEDAKGKSKDSNPVDAASELLDGNAIQDEANPSNPEGQPSQESP